MKYLITALLALAVAGFTQAQDKKDLDVQRALDTKNFVFKAESVNPARGRFRQLTSEYDLTVRRDTVVSFLPYFGRAYSAPITPSEGGIKFTSHKNSYDVKKGKNDSWQVSIRPDDNQEVQELNLVVFDNGKATLRVTSTNRESILFNGYVTEGKPLDKKAF